MSLNKEIIDLLLHEHNYIDISGNYLSVGKQTICLNDNEIFNSFLKNKINFDYLSLNRIDRDFSTRRGTGNITDKDFLKLFSKANYHCLDVSDYEGADIIHNLNYPIPDKYHESFDFILDGGVMDNLFDVVTSIQNLSKMLKPSGRILHVNSCSYYAGVYSGLSPEWFFSYYAINNYADCKVYSYILSDCGNPNNSSFESNLFLWQPFFTRSIDYDYVAGAQSIDGILYTMVVAEKDVHSSYDKKPTQMQYIDNSCYDWRKKYYQWKNTSRPLLQTQKYRKETPLPLLSDHFIYLGDI